MAETIRPTKKQRELLDFIEAFIAEHGYSPSYREIMHGCQYNSVATVALHVGSLIKRGHLRKRDHSARSLEVVRQDGSTAAEPEDEHARWLLGRVESHLSALGGRDDDESATRFAADSNILIEALLILGLHDQAEALRRRLFDTGDTAIEAQEAA